MTPWVTRIIAANAVMYILTSLRPDIQDALKFVPAEAFFQPWTAVTYMFLHGGMWHILFNMLALFFFGPRLEVELGERRFLMLYFISGLSGAALSFLFSFNTAVIGASAAVYGVFIGFTWFWPRAQLLIWGIIPVEARVMVVVMTVISLWGIFGSGGDGIAHFAHLGGFLGGWLYLRTVAPARHSGPVVQPAQTEPPPVDTAAVQRWRSIDTSAMHPVNREECLRIIAKLDHLGPSTLTPQEIGFLERFSARQSGAGSGEAG